MVENMLVPVDGSTNANRALEFACELATRFDAAVSIVHVVERAPGQQTLVLGAARATMGSRGLGGVSSLLLGSVSDKVAREAPCTCVVVR